MPHTHLPRLDQQISCSSLPLDSFRDCLQAGARELEKRFHAGEDGVSLVHMRADFMDEILQRAWQQYLPEQPDATLVAVGGYGRGELHPASDIDVMILVAAEPGGPGFCRGGRASGGDHRRAGRSCKR